jgi:hypothetical protein
LRSGISRSTPSQKCMRGKRKPLLIESARLAQSSSFVRSALHVDGLRSRLTRVIKRCICGGYAIRKSSRLNT